MKPDEKNLWEAEQNEILTILLLEDDEVDRLAVQRMAHRHGLSWTLRCAGTVAEGVWLVADGAVDLALLDHWLPDGTAFDLLGHLGETPYIFVTGSQDVAMVIEAMKAGASDFIVKDMERNYVEILPSVVRTTLEISRLRREVRRRGEELERRVEERTREARAAEERLRALAARQVAVREEERRLFAREIHDELGQVLTGLRMDLALLSSGLASTDSEVAARLAVCVGTIDQSIDLVRGLSSRLYPPILDVLGLAPALEALVEEHRGRASARFHVELPDTRPRLPKSQALALYRIAQEALTNVLRHADAGNVTVSLSSEGAGWVLEIRDDGRGIPADRLTLASSSGLVGMRERALEMKGAFAIETPEGGGTCVRVRVDAAAGPASGGTP